ncbi:MAG: LamG domain-containing protein, partial [Sulfuritalea sp.]|nr:LamG domain-containing protein [Sulfuritalea sp.]
MKSLFLHLRTRWSGPFFGLSLLRKLVWLMVLALYPALANAVTYANASTTYGWIDASTHTKLGPTTGGVYSPTYSFSNTGGCGSNVPYIDDSMSSNIPIGFTFMYGGVNFNSVRIQSNGRLQFNNNITCGYGSPVTQLPYPDAGLNYTMRIYGGDLDPSLQSEIGGGYVTNCVSRAACYVSYATIGTAPYRSFVVTWSNVPEWTSFASATGSYNVQVILQENGEFVYQYGANTPGPGNTVGQVGWQADSNDYAVPQTGYPANNTAIKFSIPQPVAEYRMEQPSWSAAAGQILDTSGRGNHASRIGAAQTTATGYLCRGALIPSNNNTGTIDAINTNLAVPTALGGAGTITFWYKPANWASNGNQDAQLFDATTASPDWFFLVKRRIDNSNVRLRFVIRDSAGNDQIAETGNLTNAVLSGTGWVHIAVSWNFNALAGANQDHMRIYVNGAQTLQTTFTTAGTVSAGIGTLYVGDNRSGTVGSSGTGRSADGTLDEVRLYNYEGGLALVQRDKDQGGTACLAHYAISHAGTARACDVVPITITAHDSSHN